MLSPKSARALPKRPASVLWASVVLAFSSAINLWLAFRGVGSVRAIVLAVIFTSAFFAVSCGGRRHLSYLCGALALAAFPLSGLWLLVIYFAAYQGGLIDPGALAVLSTTAALIMGLFTLLFYRFTFGQPSRRFYGRMPPSDIHHA